MELNMLDTNDLRDICTKCNQPIFSGDKPIMIKGPLYMDPNSRFARMNGRPVKLTPREFDMLYLLLARSPNVVSKDAIFNVVWPIDSDVDTKIIDVYVCKLRNKLGLDAEVGFLKTVWGRGYQVRFPDE
jgi:DNA-binding response OmpR family regulator